MRSLLVGLQIIASIAIIVSVMLQPSKSNGLSGLVAGSSDTFYGKNKTKTFESVMARVTVISAISFTVTTVFLNLVK